MSVSRIAVLVVDDNRDVASALERLLAEEPDLACVGVEHDADDLPGAVERTGAQVVLLDRTMPGRDPMPAMQEAAGRFPSCRFVVVSGYDDTVDIDQAFDHGAWGFVSKHASFDILLTAIRAVAAGEVYRRRS